jgi:acyl-CoA thioesterase II
VSSPADGPASDGLEGLLDLEDIDPGLFRGRISGEPGRRLFGGQVAAQALVAADRTTEASAAAHSLHAYFLRPGDTGQPVIFRVDRLQDGRTFGRRRVTATQDGTPILCLEASFTTDRSAAEHHARPPEVPEPDDCPELVRSLPGALQPDQAVELRAIVSRPGAPPRFPDDLWFRPVGKHSGERVSASAVLTYISDLTFISAILRPARRRDVSHMTSLDHVMWFHNEVRLDDWLLYVKSPVAVGSVRGLATGSIFHRDGTLIATVAQEGLMHVSR